MKKMLLLLTALYLLSLQTACQHNKEHLLHIAISSELPERAITTYASWLQRHTPEIQYTNLYPLGIDSAIRLLNSCDGLVLTGGPDVFPGIYKQMEDTARCGSFDRYRDSLEFKLLERALQMKMPVIGICRGEQLINVAFGGSLIIDIPTDYESTIIHRQDDWRNCFHEVQAVAYSQLYEWSEGNPAEVTSNHHQAIDRLGTDLKISAYSKDSLPEAIEWEQRSDHGFLMAVQWHPERMDTLHPLSAPLAIDFLKEAARFHHANPETH